MSGIMLAAAVAGGNPVIDLTNRSITWSSGGVLAAYANYRLDADGIVYKGVGSGTPFYTVLETWDTLSYTTSNYEVQVTATGDTWALTGTLGSWLNLGTQRTWSMLGSPGNYVTCTLTVQIRDTATSTVQTTATITLTADAV